MLPITGLVPANNVSNPTTHIDISPGFAMDQTGVETITLTTGTTIATSGLSAGGSYHIFIAKKADGTVTVFYDTSATNPTMPTGYIYRRILNSFLVDSSGNIEQGLWRNDGSFQFVNGTLHIQNESLQYLHLVSMRVPVGIKVEATGYFVAFNTTGAFYIFARDPDAYATGRYTTPALMSESSYYVKDPGGLLSTPYRIWTDTAGQIIVGSSSGVATTNTLHVYAGGWVHPRDENA